MSHLGVRKRDELQVLLFTGEPLLAGQHERLALGLRIEMVLAEATQPRALHVFRCASAVFACRAPQDRLNVTGMTTDLLEHGLPLYTSGGAPKASCSLSARLCHEQSVTRASLAFDTRPLMSVPYWNTGSPWDRGEAGGVHLMY